MKILIIVNMKMKTKYPKLIYLQVGEQSGDGKFDITEVTWCKDKINDNDICYIRAGKKIDEILSSKNK